MYDIYLEIVNQRQGLKEALKEYKLLMENKKLTNNKAHIKIIELHEKRLSTAKELFHLALAYDNNLKNDENFFRKLLKCYAKNHIASLEEVTDFFKSIPNKIEPTYNWMIQILYKLNKKDEALMLYKEALQLGFYKKNWH